MNLGEDRQLGLTDIVGYSQVPDTPRQVPKTFHHLTSPKMTAQPRNVRGVTLQQTAAVAASCTEVSHHCVT